MMTAQKEPEIQKIKIEQENSEEKKRLTSRIILKTSLEVAKELFIFSLVFYLLLFVLETIFPGFVSNNFNLNWILGMVLFLGIISAFAPASAEASAGKPEDEEKPKVIDYLTSIFLGVLGGSLIFYKVELSLTPRLVIAVASAVLIITISLILLMVEDEEVQEREEEIETFVKETFVSRKTFITPIAFFRLLLFKKVNFPVFLILLVFLFTALALPQKSGIAPRRLNLGQLTSLLKSAPSSEQVIEPSPTPATPGESEKKITPSAEIMIKVLNGGGGEKAVTDLAKILKDTGFAKVFFGDADNFKYKNVTIKFRPEDKDQASLIKDLLKDEYATISEAPSGTSSAEITVILGTKELEEARIEEGITVLTPE